MPELPEVETVRRGLQPVMEGAQILSVAAARPDLRFPLPRDLAARLAGKTVTSLGRRAKYLLVEVEEGPTLICHLGMSGSFRIERDTEAELPGTFHHARSRDSAHDHVVFTLLTRDAETLRIVFNDPRRFGFMLFAEGPVGEHPMLRSLGVEPTGNALDGHLLEDLLRGRKTPLKAALLDQTIVAGLGNIYVCEALWRARLSPRRIAGSIASRTSRPSERAQRLAEAIRSVIADAVQAGGSSLRDYAHADGSLGLFQHSFSVYDQEGEACQRRDGGTVKRIVQSGRSTFYCPICQR